MKKGFTLIELLVAIAIMAVVMAFALPNYLGARERARDTKKKSELAELKSALRMYYNDYQRYPPVAICGTFMGTISGCRVNGTGCCPCQANVYDFATSTDPSCNSVSTIYMKKLPANMTFGNNVDYYGVSTDGEQFCIKTPLENTSDADIAGSQRQCSTTCANTNNARQPFPAVLPVGSYLVCSD